MTIDLSRLDDAVAAQGRMLQEASAAQAALANGVAAYQDARRDHPDLSGPGRGADAQAAAAELGRLYAARRAAQTAAGQAERHVMVVLGVAP